MSRARARRCLLVWLLLPLAAGAQEKSADKPRITAAAPFAVSPGAEVALKLRGLKLTAATAVVFPEKNAGVKLVLGDKKSTDVPAGFEAKEVGDSRVEAMLTLPGDFAAEALALQVVTASGTTPVFRIPVVKTGDTVLEKEPNNGWREAQEMVIGRPVIAAIGSDKDVDVYKVVAPPGAAFIIEVFAARGPSLLDPVLTLYDAAGQVLASADDSAGRDPALEAMTPAAGMFLIGVQDAGDRGGEWHGYQLSVRPKP